MILHDFSLYTSLHLPGETRVTSVTYSTLIDFMLHVVTQNALFSLCIKKIPRNSLSRFITKHITYQKLEIPSNHSYPCPCGQLSPRMAGASNGQMQDRVSSQPGPFSPPFRQETKDFSTLKNAVHFLLYSLCATVDKLNIVSMYSTP